MQSLVILPTLRQQHVVASHMAASDMKVSASSRWQMFGVLMIAAALVYLVPLVAPEWIPHGEGVLGQPTDRVLHGIQLLLLGMICECLGRVYAETNSQPTPVVAESVGWRNRRAARSHVS
jgi:hypothetical protein